MEADLEFALRSTDPYPINLESLVDLLKYKHISSLTTHLKRHFRKDTDYKKYHQIRNKRQICVYYISVDCFKKICGFCRHSARKDIAQHLLNDIVSHKEDSDHEHSDNDMDMDEDIIMGSSFVDNNNEKSESDSTQYSFNTPKMFGRFNNINTNMSNLSFEHKPSKRENNNNNNNNTNNLTNTNLPIKRSFLSESKLGIELDAMNILNTPSYGLTASPDFQFFNDFVTSSTNSPTITSNSSMFDGSFSTLDDVERVFQDWQANRQRKNSL
eukprot:TRINITY_DN9016_c0_g1_i1.p1 TRINITY_DN9016_c0_g1~~TRINITY_DN9016_c0_g1_i1.p1  ORF type:complete len:270 (+),score=49.74 TRINITY_DN9016_c0_g1_i1:61-870(+)